MIPELRMHGATTPDTGAPEHERRASSRVCTVFFVAKVTRDHDAGLFRVRNMSDHGMRLATHVPFTAGQPVTVELLDGLAICGRVAWCRDGCCGVEFDQPIDCAAILRVRAEKKQDRRGSALRLPVDRLATVYCEKGIRPVQVVDVSRRGVCLAQAGFLEADMMIRLVTESGTSRTGLVRWADGNRAGVRLTEPLTCEELESTSYI